MTCKTCHGWVVARIEDWVPGRCPHCGEFPPFDLSAAEQLRLLQEDKRREDRDHLVRA